MTSYDFDDLYGSKYLCAADLHGGMPHCQIGRIDTVELKDQQTGAAKPRWVAYLRGIAKPLVLNRTNATRLAVAFGKDRNLWSGKTVELYAEMTSLGKEGVRLRPLPPSNGAAAPAPEPEPAPAATPEMDDAIPF